MLTLTGLMVPLANLTAQISPATSASVFNVVANNQQALKQLDAISATAERGNLFLQGPGQRIDGALADKESLSSDAPLYAGHTAGLPSNGPGNNILKKSAEAVDPDKCLTCFNVTNGGTLCCGQTSTVPYNPTTINSTALPSGGSGTIEYMWLYSTDPAVGAAGAGDPGWLLVTGASGPTYDPPSISTSTWYMRCSRRSGCIDWDGESNVVEMTVCSGSVTGLRFRDQTGTGHVNISNGGSYSQGALLDGYLLEALTSGSVGSVVFTVSGAESGDAVENISPYEYPNSGVTNWSPTVGSYTVNVKVYSGSNGTGVLCDQETFTFTITGTAPSSCNCPGNLVNNPSFESGTTGWNWWKGTLYAGTYAAQCGLNSGQFQHDNTSGDGGAYQDVTGIPAGSTISLDVFAGVHTSAYNARVGVEFYNGSTWLSGQYQDVNTILPAMNLFSFTATLPANTTKVRLIFLTDWDWVKTDNWCLTVTCSNVSNGGSITGNQNYCAPTDPPTISSVTTPTGGTGAAEYAWYYTTDCSLPVDQWTEISGATNPSYNPGLISETTCFVRRARRAGCDEYVGISNVITITINTPPTLVCESNVNNSGWTVENDCAVSVCSGSHLQLSVNPNVNTVNWSGPNGFTATGVNDIAINNIGTIQAGNYTATLTNANGCTATTTIVVTVNATPTAGITGPAFACVGQQIQLTATGGGTYKWSTGPTTATITVNPSATTTYTVTVTGAGGCTDTEKKKVDVYSAPTVTVANKTICNGSSTTLTASTTATQYLWSTGGTTATISVNPTTTTSYTVTVTNSNGCTASATGTVTVNPMPTVSVNNPTVCTGQSTTVTATSTPSTGVSYAWAVPTGVANPGNVSSFNTLIAGTYTVTVTITATGCTKVASGTVSTNMLPIPGTNVSETSGNVNNDAIICSGDPFSITGTGGTAYTWSTGATGATLSLSGVTTTTTYTVTVANANGCTATTTRVITVNQRPTASTTVTDASGTVNNDGILCNGASATITASGGTSYTWSTTATTAFITVSPTATTTYTVTVRDANGCTATATRTITVHPNPTVTVNSPTICAGQTATLTASPSGGTSYTYIWSSGETTASINKTTAGTFTVTVTNQNACTATASGTVTVNPLPTPNNSVTETSGVAINDAIICVGDPATITATGGVSYVWSNSSTGAAITVSPNASTTYTVTVTGANGCTATSTRTITVNLLPIAIIGVTDNSGNVNNDGIICAGASATLTASGGTSYTWSNGFTTSTIMVSPAATTTYTVTVRDGNGCTDTEVRTITVNPNPTPTATAPQVCVGFPVTVTATGGGTYLWATGATTSTITLPMPGAPAIVCVTVTNANGCTASACAPLTPLLPPFPGTTETDASGITINDDIICAGDAATLTGTGGTSYAWSNGGNTTSITVTPAATTTYTVTVTGANGCTATATRTITVNIVPVAVIGVTDASGTTNNDGIICAGDPATLTASGGTSYTWNTGFTTAAITVSPATTTTYTVTVRDGNGCTDTETRTITVNPLPNPSTTVTETSGNTNNDGIICSGDPFSITAIGGTVFSWSNGATTATINLTGVATTTTYTVTVRDANNCSATVTRTITVNNRPTATITVTETSGNINNDGNICYNNSASLTASGGTSYNWSTGATTATIATGNLTASTTYTVTVRDANGCTNTATRTITVNPQLTATTTQVNVSCKSGNDGSIDLTPAGGTPAYTYTWSNSATTQDISGLVAGTYTVTVRDGAGCTTTATATITEPPLLTVVTTSKVDATCLQANGSINITAAGGTPAYTYDWADIAGTSNIEDRTNLLAGTYTVTVRDAKGCTTSTSIVITDPGLPLVNAGADQTICLNSSANLSAAVTSGGTPSYSFAWSGGLGSGATKTVTPTATTTYTVTATDANGCTGTDAVIVNVIDIPYSGINGPVQRCATEGAQFQVIINGTPSNPTYAWTFSGPATPATSTASSVIVTWANVPGIYTATLVVTEQGCTKTFTRQINITAEVIANAGPDTDVCQGGSVQLSASGSSVFGNFNWTVVSGDFSDVILNPSTAAPTVSPLVTTVYQLQVTDPVNGCTRVDQVRVQVNVNLNPIANAAVNDANICPGKQVTLSAAASQPPPLDPTAPLAYTWYNGTTPIGSGVTLNVSPATTTTYSVIVVSMNTGCKDTASVTVNVLNCAKLGNFAWEDTDGDGLQDAGEPGIPGVTVVLTGTDQLSRPVSLTTTTDGSGLYLFDNLIPGTYKVTFTKPAGYSTTYLNQGSNDAIDSDADLVTGMTANEVLVPGEDNRDYDAGYYKPASIGNFVWDDTDGDGIQDAGEPGIPGVTVVLTGTTGNGTPVSATTTTNAAGQYNFTNLTPGTYKLTFTTPAGYTATFPDKGGNDALDSDADRTTGMTTTEVLVSGENNDTYDAGYFKPASLGNYVWEDTNANGIQDGGEPGISGVTVILSGTDGNGSTVGATTTTNASGQYLFPNLAPGTYKVTFTAPAGYTTTFPDKGSDDAVDSDADRVTGMTANEILVSGENNLTYDAGYFKPASIGDFVWDDKDADGVQDAGELGISGVTVVLTGTDGNGTAVSLTTTTNASGLYLFSNLAPGTYKLTFTTPAGYVVSFPDKGGNDATDSDVDRTTFMTPTETLVSGENNLTYDAGYFKPASIGNFVWEDVDADGIQDAGEPGIPGVVVTLSGTDGNGTAVSATTTTNASGNYQFTNLVPGTYKLTFTTPSGGYTVTFLDKGANDATDSDADQTTLMTVNEVLESGENNPDYDAGFYKPASIGNFVWDDVNANGLQDASEPGISGVTVVLTGTNGNGTAVSLTTTTDATGSYLFGNLVPGTYKLTFTQPAGYSTTFLDKGANDAIDSDADRVTGMTTTEVLISGENNLTYDAGYFKPASIGNYVWEDTDADGIQDAGESPISGVTVVLTGTDGNGTAVSATTTTDAAGLYLFGALVPGTYKLTFTAPAGYTTTFLDKGSNDAVDSDADRTTGMTVNETLVSGENNLTYDAGYFKPASIGNFVWDDTDGDGIQDAGEPGILGVTVVLTGTDGNGTAVSLTTTTDAAGAYLFNNLTPGTYKLTFTTPAGYTATFPDKGGDDTKDSDADRITGMTVNEILTSGENNLTYDAGYFKPASLGDYVWEDVDADGIQEVGESPISGVTVVLSGTDGNGSLVGATTTTNAAGLYLFSNLAPGTYKVTFTTPAGYSATFPDKGGDDTKDSDADRTNGMTVTEVLVSGENNLTYDAGYFKPASIGNFVWDDTDGDGIQDAGEPGIQAVTVVLTGTDGNGSPVSLTTTTDASGAYLFPNLVPGTYKLTFTTPAGFTATALDQGGNDAVDSDVNPATGMTINEVLISGENNLTYDAGYYKPASIGNYVWDDTDADGTQDAGEPAISGVTVVLSGTNGTGAVVGATTTTDANGLYLFNNLVPGTYKLTFTAPAGYTTTFQDKGGNDATDSDADRTTGMTINEILVSGENNLTYDAGYFKPASIGNFVWDDTDGDGVQDAGEPGIPGVTVVLSGTDGNGSPVSLTTTTDGSGAYLFDNLVPGTYKMTFTTPAGFTVTAIDKGGDDTKDSDVNATTGMTINEVLVSGENNLTYDAGYYKPASIGNYVWEDTNANGIQEGGEAPIQGVAVQLTGTDGTGAAVNLSTTTNAAGLYLFGNLVPGTYKLTFTQPAGYSTTFVDKGSDDAVDSDADRTTGMTINEILVSGENNLTYDAGYFKPASIGNFVWDDTDGDGIQDAGEPGISGVTVVLTGTDGNGSPVSLTTTTDGSGAYLFPNLVPGTYKLTFTTPAGFTTTALDKGGDDTKDSDVDPANGMTINEVLVSGENNLTYDAGYFKPASIGNFVWEDTDGDGAQDAGEPGIPGVTVVLTGTDGAGTAVSLTTTTNGAGQYLFGNLVPGTYKLTFTQPAGYTTTYLDQSGNDATDSDADRITGMTINEVLVSGENNLTYDAGYIKPASIGNFVWDDTDGDGIQDAGEPGIPGVTVVLTGTDGAGNPVSLTTTTDANGGYLFNNLIPGAYKLTFTTPAGFTNTAPDKGGDTVDSDVNPATGMTPVETLISGENNLTYDAGYYKPASIGNYVWEDVNGNGLQDGGEPAISGVSVTLSGVDGTGAAVNLTSTTNASGLYLFSNLVPGTYKITFGTPIGGYTVTAPDQGSDDAIDSDANATTLMTVNEVLVSGENNLTYDAGFYKPASIGNFVWDDKNGNGTQDGGEPGIPGVTVVLTGTTGAGNPVSLTTTTDGTGQYTFGNLVPGTYKLTFTTPAGGYTATALDQGGNDATDSDVNPATGMTINEVLVSGENNTTYDAGYLIPASIGNYVWEDVDGDGTQEVGEAPISGVTVVLTGTNGLGAAISLTTTTDASGLYLFNNLIPGTYKLTFTTPAGYTVTKIDQGTDATDSDVNPATGMTITEVLESGENNLTYDAGYFKPASIGNFVWDDTDGDGVQDGGEPGIPGVTVVLTGTDGTGAAVSLTTTTDGSGAYLFPNLVPGTYKLTFTTPAGFTVTAVDRGGNDATDSDVNPANGMTPTEVLISGENNLTYDAGYYKPASIGNFVWDDTDGDGVQDAGEPGVPGVSVTLTGTDGTGAAVNLTTTTDATGLYTFGNLVPGTYIVTVTQPVGYTFTAPDQGGNDATDSDSNPATGAMPAEVLVSGENNLTYDAGIYKPASLGNYVWEDTDADGIQDGGESPIPGVTVVLTGTTGSGTPVSITTTTDGSGLYLFNNLVPGTYKVTFTAPAGYTATFPDKGGDDTKDSDADRVTGMTVTEVLVSGENNLTYDAGYFKPASIGNFVWDDTDGDGIQDAGEPGIPGVTVVLTGTDGNGTPVNLTTTTDSNGQYGFNNLVPGTYVVTVTAPAGMTFTAPDRGGDDAKDSDSNPATGAMPAEVLTSGENNTTYDAGLFKPASLGNYVWEDTDANGIQDAGEPAISGVTVVLSGTNGLGSPVSATTTTNAAGEYLFGNLLPGTYKVTFTKPVGYSTTTPDKGSNDAVDSDADPLTGMTVTEVLVSGENNLTYDAGYFKPASIGDFVWDDTNGNGIQDGGEPGISGVTVVLSGTDGSGNPVSATTTTNGSGAYLFPNLVPGTYKLTFTTPGGYTMTPADRGGDDTKDSDVNPATSMTPNEVLVSGENNLTYDAGYFKPASLGNYVWEDVNANGIQDGGEPGIQGVTVVLSGTDGNGTAVNATTTTNASGQYLFGNLAPGTYKVTFTAPAGFTTTFQDRGGDDALDSDADRVTGMTINEVLTSGETNLTYDAGYFKPASIGNFVWDDTDADGVQDAGEPGIPGVTVVLSGTDGAGNPVNATTTTDGVGGYLFPNLAPGTYKLTFTTPAGYTVTAVDKGGNDALDSDVNAGTGMTPNEVLVSGENNLTYDAGYFKPASIGNFVWDDVDGDGVQDAGEPGIPGVTVVLSGTDGAGNPVSATTTTDANGGYTFNNLVPGDYKVTFTAPAGYTFTPADKGGNDATDSDANPANGMTPVETLVSGENNTTYDAGLFKPASLGNYVWEDTNANGVQDAGENPISGVSVTLTGTDGNGNPVSANQFTNAAGEYLFSNLAPGTYKVTFGTPAGYTVTFPDKGGDDAKDSDADRVTLMTINEVLTSGETNLTYDAGFFKPASIGNFVWDDKDGDGTQDGGEPGIPGVTVVLSGTDGNGTPVNATTTTDGSGNYTFNNLVPGTYKVTFTAPAGYTFTPADLGGNDATDSDANPTNGMTTTEVLTSGENNTTYDAGLFKPASLGNYVWEDTDADGIQELGESPISGVTVVLSGTDGAGNPVNATTTTDASGLYLFGNLAPGTYKVTFTTPAGYSATAKDKGGNDATDSDADPVTGMTTTEILESGETNLTYDAGYFKPASIGNFVWDDVDGDGTQDAGEPGIPGVTVVLTGTDGAGNPVSATTTTDANGGYTFPNLVPGDYKVTFTAPVGTTFTAPDQGGNDATDSDANPANGMTLVETLVSGENNTTYDAGLIKPASIGNFVWDDKDGDGTQDAGEPGIPNVTVVLTGTTGSGTPVSATTTTDANGGYTFNNLVPGTYKVTFTAPAGYTFTLADLGGNDATDSDANPANGMTVTEVLTSGENNTPLDRSEVAADRCERGPRLRVGGLSVSDRVRHGIGAAGLVVRGARGGSFAGRRVRESHPGISSPLVRARVG